MEYGLLIALVAVVIIGAVGFLGRNLSSVFTGAGESIPAGGAANRPTGNLCGTANEGSTVDLTVPDGSVITAIDFLSYGTPTGSCGGFSVGACHATKDYSSAIGQTSISVPMVNGNFGDPCGGTYKHGYLQITYG